MPRHFLLEVTEATQVRTTYALRGSSMTAPTPTGDETSPEAWLGLYNIVVCAM